MKASSRERTCIVVCADGAIFELLVGLLLSLRPLDRQRFAVAIIDTGLSEAQRRCLGDLCDAISPVRDDLLVPLDPRLAALIEPKSPFWRAQACRPFLRDYFPGFRHYVHLDADMWVQRPGLFFDAVEAMLDEGRVVIVPESDVAYPIASDLEKNQVYFTEKAAITRQVFGPDIERQMGAFTYFNTGFFGMRHDLAHWELFANYLRGVFGRSYHHLSEQLTFNVVLMKLGGFTLLPAVCNWMCTLSTPIRGQDGLLRSPRYPHDVIEILHLTGTDKMARYRDSGLLFDQGRYLPELVARLKAAGE